MSVTDAAYRAVIEYETNNGIPPAVLVMRVENYRLMSEEMTRAAWSPGESTPFITPERFPSDGQPLIIAIPDAFWVDGPRAFGSAITEMLRS